MRPALLHRLTVRFSLALCLGAGVLLAGAAAWNLELQRAHLTELVELQATEVAEVIRSSTRDAMLRNEASEVRRIIQTVASGRAIDRVRVFDKQGRISSSSDPDEPGRLVDISAEQCVSCHQTGRPLLHLDGADRTRSFRRADGTRILGVIAPIHNELSCSTAACHAHPASTTVLGVLDVQLSLEGVEEHLAASERQLFLGLAGSVGALVLLAWMLTWRMVLDPVARLTAATSGVGAGEAVPPLPVRSHDELGRLAGAWNAMITRLADAHRELAEWSQTLEEKVAAKTGELETAHQRMLVVERMASLGKLAAVVAHELNNPLTGIATYAKLLRRRGERQAGGVPAQGERDPQQILRLIEEEALRCGEIVRNLLLFSRSPAGRFAREELAPLLERSVMLLRHKADLQEVRLGIETAPGLAPVRCDAAQVQQLVLALAVNALEATSAGGSVTLRARPAEEGWAAIEVGDTGRGIEPEDLDRIFEPFFTTKPSGAGVGLGLAVAFGIVQRHGGTIAVESRLGQGTTFTVRLPLAGPPASEPPNGRGVDGARCPALLDLTGAKP